MDRLIQKDIENDYLKGCISSFKTIQSNLKNINELLIENPQNQSELIQNEGIIDDLVKRLGLVGEFAFKYLLKTKQTEIYPHQNYDAFQNQAIFKKGTIRDLTTRGYLTEKERDEILSFTDDNNQLFHNYNYLGLIVKHLLKETDNSFNNFFKYSFQSQYIKEIINEEIKNGKISNIKESNYFKALLFPYIYDIESEESQNLDEIALKIIKKGKEAGDVFTRFRYFSNNQVNQKHYSLQDALDINYYINQLVNFTERIYEENSNLNIDIEQAYGRTMALEYAAELGRSHDEINEILNDTNEDLLTRINKLLSDCTIEDINYIKSLCKKYNLEESVVFDQQTNINILLNIHNNKAYNDETKEKTINYYFNEQKDNEYLYNEYYDIFQYYNYEGPDSEEFRKWRNSYYDMLYGFDEYNEEESNKDNDIEYFDYNDDDECYYNYYPIDRYEDEEEAQSIDFYDLPLETRAWHKEFEEIYNDTLTDYNRIIYKSKEKKKMR